MGGEPQREYQPAAVRSRAMAPNSSTAVADRVTERRPAVALARHYREFEGLSTAQIAQRLGRSPATVKAYFYDPTGEKARAVKARYQGVCRGCGAYTQARNGKGDAYAYCKACHPGRWTALDSRARARGDARMALPLWPAAVLLRLVAHACTPAWGRCARATRRKRVAISERRYAAIRNMAAACAAALRQEAEAQRDRLDAPAVCRFASRRRSARD
jgi:AraC-like DNA-binding protein